MHELLEIRKFPNCLPYEEKLYISWNFPVAEFELFNFGVFEVQVEGVPGFSLVPLFERP